MTEQERQGGWQFPPIPDVDCIKLTGLARNTYYKYKRQIREDAEMKDWLLCKRSRCKSGQKEHGTFKTRMPCSFFVACVGWTTIPSIKIFIMRLEKLIRLCDKRRRAYEKILDDTTECCICAELCACGWNDWRVHFATPGVLYHHRWDDEHSLSVQARMAAQESFALTF